ncbi:C-type lectin domain family 17, member A, partial [Galemys pyrenaicus]
MAPPRPPRAGKKTEKPPLPHKPPKSTGLDVTPAISTSQLATPVPWLNRKSRSSWCYEEERLMCLCLLVVVSLLLSCTALIGEDGAGETLGVGRGRTRAQAGLFFIDQEVVEELRMLTFEQMAWRANVTGMKGLAGLKKDVDHLRDGTNQSLVELRGLLGCNRVTCPEGWLPFDGKCYYFSQVTKSWEEARKFCQENYSHLVIISNFAEQNFLAKAHGSPRVYWLGLSDRHQEKEWKWLDGTPVTFWEPQEPNNHNEEDCGSMNKGGTWNDLSCDKTTYWI